MADPTTTTMSASTNLVPPQTSTGSSLNIEPQSQSQAPPPQSTTTQSTTLPPSTEALPLPLSPIILRVPHRYETPSSSITPPSQPAGTPEAQAAANSGLPWTPPPLQWLQRTWTVTHSTLPMWRNAKNVRITYKILPPSQPGGKVCLDDTVESSPTKRTLLPQPKKIEGIDTPDPEREGAWDWRGKGLLRIASSHWEVLGWGEWGEGEGQRERERWVVTWFAPSLFTPAGVDVYSDRKEGGSEALVRDVLGALERMGCREA
ncbi:hypothetical protein EG329_000392 [Mollisiaceae sp. DMI_Dod_QoI]|nr:hypothetical protein EG329_000392 [Helotiales sp. DMI_Dod_QoI]